MALGDITFYESGSVGSPNSVRYAVAASSTLIYPGEPVNKELGAAAVDPAATATPVVATDWWAGIAMTTSTNTASVAGVVDVSVLQKGMTYLIAPIAPTTWDTQSEYDALVGDRVVLDLTNGVYTLVSGDSSGNGLVVMPLDIKKFPGKVRFAIRQAVDYLA